jgi:glycosyltransferase involved in cell wall biosynthesis
MLNGRALLMRVYQTILWWHVRIGTDGALVHVPLIADRMAADGYTKPTLIQTQIGVDPDVFYPDKTQGAAVRQELGLSGTVVGYAGRIIENKGIPQLLQALEGLSGAWSLLLVGDGPFRNEVERWASKKGWCDRVRITGQVGVNEVARFMRAMDIFAFGSLVKPEQNYWDMFPLVVAQAMATGLPVVGSDGGGVPYQLGGKGLLFPPGDAKTLRARLEYLMSNIHLRWEIGNDLFQRAQSEFCIPAMNKTFVSFVNQLVEK